MTRAQETSRDEAAAHCVEAARFASFALALAACRTVPRGTLAILLRVRNNQPIYEDTRIPPEVTLEILEGGAISGPHTLTVAGSLQAGRYRIFGDTLDVLLEKRSVCWAYPHWWGGGSLAQAVLGTGTFQELLIVSNETIFVKATIPPTS